MAIQEEEKLNLVPDPQWKSLEQWVSGDKDYKTNKILNALLNAALITDWYVTDKNIQEGAWEKDKCEANPLLGEHPNREQLAIAAITFLLGNALLPKIIGPKYTDIIRSQILANDINCIRSWLEPNFQWDENNAWKLTIPFKF